MKRDFVAVDYSRDMVILAVVEEDEDVPKQEMVVGVGQYSLNRDVHTAEVALVVRDDYQEMGISAEISYLRRQGQIPVGHDDRPRILPLSLPRHRQGLFETFCVPEKAHLRKLRPHGGDEDQVFF